jgi:hypothetical protein
VLHGATRCHWCNAEYVKEQITKKMKKLNNGHYKEFDKYGLYVFSEYTLGEESEIAEIIDFIVEEQKRYEGGGRIFSHLFVQHQPNVLHYIDVSSEEKITKRIIMQDADRSFFCENLEARATFFR